jgi:hypothetical protein
MSRYPCPSTKWQRWKDLHTSSSQLSWIEHVQKIGSTSVQLCARKNVQQGAIAAMSFETIMSNYQFLAVSLSTICPLDLRPTSGAQRKEASHSKNMLDTKVVQTSGTTNRLRRFKSPILLNSSHSTNGKGEKTCLLSSSYINCGFDWTCPNLFAHPSSFDRINLKALQFCRNTGSWQPQKRSTCPQFKASNTYRSLPNCTLAKPKCEHVLWLHWCASEYTGSMAPFPAPHSGVVWGQFAKAPSSTTVAE